MKCAFSGKIEGIESEEEMTREEATAILKTEADYLFGNDKPYNREAFEMAISALSAEPCEDTISRIDMHKLLDDCTVGGWVEVEEKIFHQLVNELPPVENKGEWIPVSERLPDNNVRVLCSAISTSISGGYTCFVGCCNNGFWFVQTDAETVSYPRQYEVTAWMPLPEPYKAEKGGE